MTIEVRITIDGEPAYGELVDVIPEPEHGAYLLIARAADGTTRKLGFRDPAQADYAEALAEAEAAVEDELKAHARRRAADARLAGLRAKTERDIQKRRDDALALQTEGAPDPGTAQPGTDPGPATS